MGYLDARCRNSQQVVERFGLWCWRMKIPMVWFERQSPRSRYGRVHLELFTTANRLTAGGQEALKALYSAVTVKGTSNVSSHSSHCTFVPLDKIEDLARAIFRSAVRSCEPDARDAGAPSLGSWRAASA